MQDTRELEAIGKLVTPCARKALDILEDAGYEAWFVGGFVRDALLGKPCSDIDIATSASWREAKRAFEDAGCYARETGVAHGTITAVIDKHAFEATTYRVDGSYLDGRHPSEVYQARSIEEDLARRDFTVNALAFHPERGIVDPYGGRQDLKAGVIRAVGDPMKRFEEDALRILRACRFSSQLGFSIEEETYASLCARKSMLFRISKERIAHELDLFVQGDYVHDALMGTADVLAAVLPELIAMKGFAQHTPYHIYDVLEHTAWALQHSPKSRLVRWAVLFHDSGKPAAYFAGKDGVGHFYGHPHISVCLAKSAFGRLGFSAAFCDKALALIKYHDDVIEPMPKAVKRALVRLDGDVDMFRALCDVKRADAKAQAPQCASRVQLADELERQLACILEEHQAFSLRDLAINGHDVMSVGIPSGRLVGAALNAALNAVVEGSVENEAEALKEFVREWFAQSK